jgi:hypothetical protein
MAIKAAYAGSTDHNNSKGLLFKLTFSGNYGVNGVGDLVDLSPNAVSDPGSDYNQPLCQAPKNPGVESENLGGYYIQLTPNANPSLSNLGVRVFAPGGGELATNAAYAAAVTGGSATILAFLPLQ